MYFDVKTIEEAKNKFHDLYKMLHPDSSGYDSKNDFVEMFNEFRTFKPTVTVYDEEEKDFDADEFYNLLKHFDVLINIKINFIGSFIWLEDLEVKATFNQKETIKTIVLEGFTSARFAPVRKLWYFAPENYKQKRKSKKTFEEIKEKWGTTSFQTKTH